MTTRGHCSQSWHLNGTIKKFDDKTIKKKKCHWIFCEIWSWDSKVCSWKTVREQRFLVSGTVWWKPMYELWHLWYDEEPTEISARKHHRRNEKEKKMETTFFFLWNWQNVSSFCLFHFKNISQFHGFLRNRTWLFPHRQEPVSSSVWLSGPQGACCPPTQDLGESAVDLMRIGPDTVLSCCLPQQPVTPPYLLPPPSPSSHFLLPVLLCRWWCHGGCCNLRLNYW